MRYFTSAIAAIAVVGSFSLHGAGLKLNEAIEILKSQNLEIKAARLDQKSLQEDVAIAQSYHYGSLDLTQSFARSNDAGNVFGFKLSAREANFGDFGFSEFLACQSATPPSFCANILGHEPKDLNYPGYENYFQTKLTYSVPLYTGGKLSAYGEISEKMEKIKSLDASSVTNEKIYQTRKAYYDMALLDHSIAQMKKVDKTVSRLEKTTLAMIDAGYAKKIDLLEVQAKKANVERLIGEMESNQKLILHLLSFLLNQKVNEIELPSDDAVSSHVDGTKVLDNNLDLQKASRGLEIRESMIDVAYAPFLPQIGAFAEASSADNTFLGDFLDHKAFTIGARLSWNIFNGGIDSHGIEKARIEQLKTKTQLELAKKGVSLQYDQIQTEIENYDRQIQSLEKELELANAVYENYEGRYREHLVSMNDVLIKHSLQIEKIIALNTAKNQRNERVFALEKLSNGEHQ